MLLAAMVATALSAGAQAEPQTALNDSSIVPGDAGVPVTASQSPDDLRVTQQIRAALQSDSTLMPDVNRLVRVATNGQAVILRGALPTTRDIERVTALAENYCGARQVINELTVIDSATEARIPHV